MQQIIALAGQGVSRLSGTFACGLVANRLPEVRRAEMHEGVVVSWLLAGSGSLLLDGTLRRLPPGTTCLRRPDRRYAMTLDAQMQHVRLFLKLPEAAYPLLCQLLPGLDTIDAVHPMPFREKTLRQALSLIEALRQTDDSSVYRLLPDAISLLVSLTALSHPAAEDALARAASLLQDSRHFRTPLPDIAALAGLSYATLRKQFAPRYGTSPGQFRLRKKMELAQQALASGDSIVDVSERYGFADVYAFSKQFRAVTGETPGQYRRHHII